MPLAIGDTAPDFTKEAHTGETVSLSSFRGQKTVVLYFYPQDNTPGCTTEACAFRDAYEEFVRAGAIVIGVSGDSLESHRRFASAKKLPFLLISDADGTLRKAYGVPKTLFVLPGRMTFVIDKQGVVRHVFNSQLFASQHVTEALAMVRQLGA